MPPGRSPRPARTDRPSDAGVTVTAGRPGDGTERADHRPTERPTRWPPARRRGRRPGRPRPAVRRSRCPASAARRAGASGARRCRSRPPSPRSGPPCSSYLPVVAVSACPQSRGRRRPRRCRRRRRWPAGCSATACRSARPIGPLGLAPLLLAVADRLAARPGRGARHPRDRRPRPAPPDRRWSPAGGASAVGYAAARRRWPRTVVSRAGHGGRPVAGPGSPSPCSAWSARWLGALARHRRARPRWPAGCPGRCATAIRTGLVAALLILGAGAARHGAGASRSAAATPRQIAALPHRRRRPGRHHAARAWPTARTLAVWARRATCSARASRSAPARRSAPPR